MYWDKYCTVNPRYMNTQQECMKCRLETYFKMFDSGYAHFKMFDSGLHMKKAAEKFAASKGCKYDL